MADRLTPAEVLDGMLTGPTASEAVLRHLADAGYEVVPKSRKPEPWVTYDEDGTPWRVSVEGRNPLNLYDDRVRRAIIDRITENSVNDGQ